MLNRTLVKSWAALPVTVENSCNITSTSSLVTRFVCLYQVSLTFSQEQRYRQESSLTVSSLLARPLENWDQIPRSSRDISLFHSIQTGSGPQSSTTFYITIDLSLLNTHGRWHFHNSESRHRRQTFHTNNLLLSVRLPVFDACLNSVPHAK